MTQRKPAAKRARPKAKYRFTKEDCQRGYQPTLAKCMEDWNLYAWFFRKLRKQYDRKEQP